ncbi:hypothetical protein MNBD_GAMMA14-461 [hydrothermal vent metagenome]|uniref:Centromere protein J C-terminal domain-containing protein n=1 Tax=hydrothermal vent metagenome TaxID=652676 RepID=A0A3B0Y9Z7_9ZZZZ
MGRSKIQNNIGILLASLFCLAWTGHVSAADKKQTTSVKPAVSRNIAPLPQVVTPLPKSRARSKVKIPSSSLASPGTGSAAIPVMPALPGGVPSRQALPVAPPVLNPRGQGAAKPPRLKVPSVVGGSHTATGRNKSGGGFRITPPGYGRTTRPVQPKRSGTGTSSAPGRGFVLSPLTRPESGVAGQGQGRGTGNRAGRQSPTTPVQRAGGTRSLLPGRTQGATASGSLQPAHRGAGSGGFAGGSAADSRDTTAAGRPDSGSRTAAPAFIGPVTETRVPNGDGTTTSYSRDGSDRTFRSYTNTNNGMVADFNDDGSVTLNSPGGESTTLGNDGTITTTYFDGSSDTLNQDGSRTRTSVTGATETYNTDGSITRTRPDGSSEVEYPGGARTVTRPDGVVETYADDGSMSGITSVTNEDGSGSVNFPDGSRAEYDSDKNTTYYNVNGTTTRTTNYADGTEEIEYPNGTIRETTPDGTRTTRYPDGTIIEETEGGTVIHGADGSLTVENSPGDSANRNIKSAVRYNADGTVTETYDDGTGSYTSQSETGAESSSRPGEQGTASRDKDTERDKNDNRTDDNGDTPDTDDEKKSDSGDDTDDDSGNDSAGNDGSDSGDDDGKDSDSGDNDSGSDEVRGGFEDGRNNDGGPTATSVVDDRVARMKGEKHDPESPDDSEPGNGGSAPGKVSQPGPGGGRSGSPLARPSAEGHKSLVNGVVVPTVKTRSSVGGGDCFKPDGCDDVPTGDFQLDPFNRDPVTNPGGG